jgi:hypothetical protein
MEDLEDRTKKRCHGKIKSQVLQQQIGADWIRLPKRIRKAHVSRGNRFQPTNPVHMLASFIEEGIHTEILPQ